MSEEFRHHLELRTQDLVRQGLTPREAARRARIEFGHIERHKEDARAARGLRLFDQISFSWLDIKLGVRMLAKYPGLSLVSVVGMAIAIAIAAGGFGFLHAALADVPLPEGDRLVVLQNTDPSTPGIPDRHAVRDFLRWREQLESVRDLAAFTTERTSINVAGAAPAPATVARITASGFRAARVDPLFGRTLLEEDERDGAPPAVVVAYGEWQRRLGGDPDVLGREIRLGMTEHTVVGVMPEGFRFPVNHGYWIPLSIDPAVEADAGPEITMFGRLAEGATIGRAQTELTTIGHLGAEGGSEARARLRPRVLAYTESFMGIDGPQRAWLLRTVEIVLSLLLVVVAVNVSVLVYARTAARMGEIATRTALGASRRRVVSQLFAEAFVLSVIAAFVGVGLAVSGFGWMRRLINFGNPDELPFWIDLSLSPALAAYVTGLAVMAAVITGVVPALQATGRGIQTRLQELHSGGSRLRLGRTWTALIVAQVAIAVAVLPYTLYVAGPAVRRGLAEPDYAVHEFLRVSLTVEDPAVDPDGASRSRFLASAEELVRRLEAEPAVAGVAFASRFPGSEAVVGMEIEGVEGRTGAWVSRIDPDLLTLFDVPILAGRAFAASDALPGSTPVIVDRVFAEELLGGQNVLGRHVRLLGDGSGDASTEDGRGAWLEVVGVVPAFTVPPVFQPAAPKLYRPLTLADAPDPLALAIRIRRDTSPLAFTGRLREMTEAVDARLELSGLETAAADERERRGLLLLMAVVVIAVTGSVLLLSAAGVYAMMSFTIASRRREMGIRAALGAAPTRVLDGVLRRAMRQLVTGVMGGLAMAEVVVRILGGSFLTGEGTHLLPLVALAMTVTGLLATLGPVRRGLAVQPTEALRAE
jgi:predicted permease